MENKKDHNIPKNSCISFAERPHTHKTPSPAVNHTQEASPGAGKGGNWKKNNWEIRESVKRKSEKESEGEWK